MEQQTISAPPFPLQSTVAEADIIARVIPDSPEATLSIIESPRYDHHIGHIVLRFSEIPKDLTRGFCFGKNATQNDIHIDAAGVGRSQFRICPNWHTGYLVLSGQSTYSTSVISGSLATRLRNKSCVLRDRDLIQVGILQWRVEIPSYKCRERFEKNLQAYKQMATMSLPGLSSLSIMENCMATMGQPGQITLLSNDEAALLPDGKVFQSAIDCYGHVYAVKRWTRKKEDFQKLRSVSCVSSTPAFHSLVLILIPKSNLVDVHTEKFVEWGIEYFVMEYLKPDTLDKQEQLTPDEVATTLEQLLLAVAHLHEREIVHWNIKPSNIHFKSRKPLLCKLGGFATIKNSKWMAPEVVKRGEVSKDDYPCDIWSLGLVILHLCLFDQWRLRLSEWPTICGQVLRPGPAWKALTNFATKMMNPDPSSRPTATDCLERLCHLDVKQENQSPIETNIQFLSNHVSKYKKLPGLYGEGYCSLLPTIIVSSDTQELVVPYSKLSQTLLSQVPEIDHLLRDRRYRSDGQDYISLERTISTLQTAESRASVTTLLYLRLFVEYVKYVHLGRIYQRGYCVVWTFN